LSIESGRAGAPSAAGMRAVFLSYAHEDAEVAQKICTALREAGIEVWFDRSELRGGDSWDSAIRKQIKACSLFIPIISRNSHLRGEGYFRLEWKLAVDRSHLMAADKAFLVPVVTDDTTIADDRVPDRFRDVQWIQLPDGVATGAFVEQILRLLNQAVVVPPAYALPLTPSTAAVTRVLSADVPPDQVTIPKPPRSMGARAVMLIAAVAVIGLSAWALRGVLFHTDKVLPYSIQDRRLTFAVLPFQGPEGDAHGKLVAKTTGNALRSDFETHTLFTHIASPSDVEEALKHNTSPKDIAKTLNVHFLIRGTADKTATGYVVNTAVIDGETERVLADRSLKIVGDALAPRYHDEIGDARLHLSDGGLTMEVERAANKPDDALDVRDLSLRALNNWLKGTDKRAQGAYTSATELLRRALLQAPDDHAAIYLTALINLCDCVMAWSHDVEHQKQIGAAALERYLQIDPNDLSMLVDKAELFQLRGRYEESNIILDGILQREPENSDALSTKAAGLLHLKRPKEALVLANQVYERYPNEWPELTGLVANIRYELGEYAPAAELARKSATQMSESSLRNPITGPIRLTLAAAESHLGRLDRAKAALEDFSGSVPNTQSISAIKKWMHPMADLPPLFEDLKLAGVKD
jgi:tetratricopeptide (TPR) repeat protein